MNILRKIYSSCTGEEWVGIAITLVVIIAVEVMT